MSWQMTDEWIAGFFDGEGCVTISRRRRTANFIEHLISVQIAQKDPRPIYALHERFGGCVSLACRPGGTFHYLRWHGLEAERFLRVIQPHCLVKRSEIDLALELRAHIGLPGRRVSKGVFAKKEVIWGRFRDLRNGLALPS